jgi:hypothetical protein
MSPSFPPVDDALTLLPALLGAARLGITRHAVRVAL